MNSPSFEGALCRAFAATERQTIGLTKDKHETG